MLRAFHALTRVTGVALSISVLVGVVASAAFLSGCSDQSGQQASSPPEGPAEQVLRDAEESTWFQAVRAGTLGAFADYRQNFPNGKHVNEARELIAALEAHARKDADENAWSEAQRSGSAAGFEDYLRTFPNGAQAAQARERIAALTGTNSPSTAEAKADNSGDKKAVTSKTKPKRTSGPTKTATSGAAAHKATPSNPLFRWFWQ